MHLIDKSVCALSEQQQKRENDSVFPKIMAAAAPTTTAVHS